MPRAKKVEAAVEAVEEKVEAAVEAVEKKAAAKKKTASAAKKTAEKKTETAAKVVIQFGGSEADTAALVEKAKAEAGVKTAKQVDVYVKPEVNRVYYVIDGDKLGDFVLFE